jgi:hypothetical protein
MQREAFNMQAVGIETKSHYSNGFKKKIDRSKYDLPLNDRLKKARNRKGLSSAGVVQALKKQGISIGHSTLQGYEAHENSLNHRYPSLSVLITLADFYEINSRLAIWQLATTQILRTLLKVVFLLCIMALS